MRFRLDPATHVADPASGGDHAAVDLEVSPELGGGPAHEPTNGALPDRPHGATPQRRLHRRPLERDQLRYLAIVLQLAPVSSRE